MVTVLVKFTAPLVLLTALLFLSGVITVSASFAGAVTADQCCGSEIPQHDPGSEGECIDPDCRCLSCSVSVLDNNSLSFSSLEILPTLLKTPPDGAPSDFIRSIDYPPEFL